jgi:cytochrome o ubiquinol oxidase subunit 1
MPKNSPTGFVTAFFATLIGFALIWHIWWLVWLGLFCVFATFVVFAWRDVSEFEIPADEVARIDRARRAAREDLLNEIAQRGERPA